MPFPRFGMMLVAALLSCWFVGGTTLGQGTSGQLPDPISVRDLERYSMRLGLSEQQKQAVFDMHGAYLADFRILRDTEIEEYLQSNSAGGMFRLFMNPDEAEMKKSVRDLEDVLDSIRTTDNRLFDTMQTILTEDQLVLLDQVRKNRERTRHQSTVTRVTLGAFNPAATTDIGRMFDDLDLSAQDRAAAMPLVQHYESAMAVATRDFFEKSMRMPLKMMKKMRDEGIDLNSPTRDRERRTAMFQRLGELFVEAQVEMSGEMNDLADLNRRSIRQLMSVLPRDAGRDLQREYLQRSYFEVPSGDGEASRHFRRALEMELDESTQTAVLDARTSYEDQVDAVRGRMLDAVDKHRQVPRNFFRFDGDNQNADDDEQEKFEKRMDDHRAQLERINEQSLDALASILGEERITTLRRHVEENDGDHAEHVTTEAIVMLSDGGGTFVTNLSGNVGSLTMTVHGESVDLSDPYLPSAITSRELDRYSDRLGLEDFDRDVVRTLHDDYKDRYDEIRSSRLKAVKDAERRQWEFDAESNRMKPPSPADVSNLFQLRRDALQAILALDHAFFDDIRTALLEPEDEPQLERVRLDRQRTVYNRSAVASSGGAMMFRGRGGPGGRIALSMGGESHESTIDVARLLDDLELEPEHMAMLDPEIMKYEQAVTDAFRTRYEAALRTQEAMDKLMAEQAEVEGDDTSRSIRFAGGGQMRDIMATDGQSAEDAGRTIVEHNHALLERAASNLPRSLADDLRLAYDRKAFPDIYNDHTSAEPALQAALGLPDLTASQREQINDLAMEYRSGYADVSTRMVEVNRNRSEDGGSPFGRNRNWQAMQERQRETEKLRFERDDLSSKTIARLRSVLRPEQIDRLPSPEIH